MTNPVERLQQTIDELANQVRRLEARVDALEAGRGPHPGPAPLEEEEFGLKLPVDALPQGGLALLGRTLVVLAGGFMIRALTDGHILPAAAGVGLGLAYAVFWQFVSLRDARSGRRQSAVFHSLASSLIAFPLLWETTARFGLLGPRLAAAALVAFFALGLWVALRSQLAVGAAVVTILSLVTAVALFVSTHDLLAAMVTLLALAGGLEWLAWRDQWRPLRWPAAVVLDGLALLVVLVMTRAQGLPEGYVPLSATAGAGVLLALPFLYIVGLAVRTVFLERLITPFGVVQGSAAVLIGFVGAWRVLEAAGQSPKGLGILAVVLAALCYAAAFAFAERRAGQERNFYFYATAGGLLALGGTSALGLGPGLAIVWAILGLAAAVLGRRFQRTTLRVHGALYLLAAAIQAGLLSSCLRALAGMEAAPLSVSGLAVAVAVGVGYVVLSTDPRAAVTGWERTPQLAVALIGVLALVHLLHVGAGKMLDGAPAADRGLAATTLTAILALVITALAWFSRSGSQPELGWLVYPLIAVAGLKLLLRDLPHGRPATLVLSLAVYGAVLILTPRLLRPRS